MFKTFASALLAACVLADTDDNFGTPSNQRGDNGGSDNEKATYCNMIANDGKKVKLDLYTYLKRENKVVEWHGETKLYVLDATYVADKTMIEYGFCLQMTAAKAAEGDNPAVKETWDCSSVQAKPVASADGKKVVQTTTNQFFNNKDWKYEGSKADFRWDNVVTSGKLEVDKKKDGENVVESNTDDSKNNFQISNSKSHTNCTIASNKINCARPKQADDLATWMDSGITYHWFRNFSTADAAGYDIQLGKDDGNREISAFAFAWTWWDDTKTNAKPQVEVLNEGSAYGCNAITASAYKTLVTDVEAAEKKKAEEEAAKKKDTNDDKKDGATQTTAYATALLAAVYALVF